MLRHHLTAKHHPRRSELGDGEHRGGRADLRRIGDCPVLPAQSIPTGARPPARAFSSGLATYHRHLPHRGAPTTGRALVRTGNLFDRTLGSPGALHPDEQHYHLSAARTHHRQWDLPSDRQPPDPVPRWMGRCTSGTTGRCTTQTLPPLHPTGDHPRHDASHSLHLRWLRPSDQYTARRYCRRER